MYLVSGSHLRAHFCCFLGVLEKKLIILSICVKKFCEKLKLKVRVNCSSKTFVYGISLGQYTDLI